MPASDVFTHNKLLVRCFRTTAYHDIIKVFDKFGKIDTVYPSDRESKHPKENWYVKFCKASDACRAMEALDETLQFGGTTPIAVKVIPKYEWNEAESKDEERVRLSRVFVAPTGMSDKSGWTALNQDEVRKEFSQYGRIVETSYARGLKSVIITFEKPSQAASAVEKFRKDYFVEYCDPSRFTIRRKRPESTQAPFYGQEPPIKASKRERSASPISPAKKSTVSKHRSIDVTDFVTGAGNLLNNPSRTCDLYVKINYVLSRESAFRLCNLVPGLTGVKLQKVTGEGTQKSTIFLVQYSTAASATWAWEKLQDLEYPPGAYVRVRYADAGFPMDWDLSEQFDTHAEIKNEEVLARSTPLSTNNSETESTKQPGTSFSEAELNSLDNSTTTIDPKKNLTSMKPMVSSPSVNASTPNASAVTVAAPKLNYPVLMTVLSSLNLPLPIDSALTETTPIPPPSTTAATKTNVTYSPLLATPTFSVSTTGGISSPTVVASLSTTMTSLKDASSIVASSITVPSETASVSKNVVILPRNSEVIAALHSPVLSVQTKPLVEVGAAKQEAARSSPLMKIVTDRQSLSSSRPQRGPLIPLPPPIVANEQPTLVEKTQLASTKVVCESPLSNSQSSATTLSPTTEPPKSTNTIPLSASDVTNAPDASTKFASESTATADSSTEQTPSVTPVQATLGDKTTGRRKTLLGDLLLEQISPNSQTSVDSETSSTCGRIWPARKAVSSCNERFSADDSVPKGVSSPASIISSTEVLSLMKGASSKMTLSSLNTTISARTASEPSLGISLPNTMQTTSPAGYIAVERPDPLITTRLFPKKTPITTRLYFFANGSVPLNMLRQEFESHGHLVQLSLISGQNSGYAVYNDKQSALQAEKRLNQSMFGRVRLTVLLSDANPVYRKFVSETVIKT